MLTCPHCHNAFADAPDLAGQLVACPHCGQHVQLPRAVAGELMFAPEPQMPAFPTFQQQPSTIVIAAPPRERRLDSGGWFARSFASASGVLLAVLLILVIAPMLLMFLFCGGIAAIGRTVPTGQDSAVEATAKKHALTALQRHGIASLAQEVTAGRDLDGLWVVSGPAIKRDGRLSDVYVSYRVATAGGKTRWQLVNVMIDRDVVVADGVMQ